MSHRGYHKIVNLDYLLLIITDTNISILLLQLELFHFLISSVVAYSSLLIICEDTNISVCLVKILEFKAQRFSQFFFVIDRSDLFKIQDSDHCWDTWQWFSIRE